MEIRSRVVGDVLVVDIGGHLTQSESYVPSIYEHVKPQLEIGKRKVIFNLDNAGLVDSFGVGQILECGIAIKKLGGELKLSGALPMQVGRLPIIPLFEVYPNVEAALESFAKP